MLVLATIRYVNMLQKVAQSDEQCVNLNKNNLYSKMKLWEFWQTM